MLVRMDAPSKEALKRLPIMIGAAPGSLSAVRLSRLPGCERLGREDKQGHHHKLEDGPHLQRLFYPNPQSDGTPITEKALPQAALES